MKILRTYLLSLTLAFALSATCKPIDVLFRPSKGCFTLVERGKAASIMADENEAEVVHTAVDLFIKDVTTISGATPSKGEDIIVGTIGQSASIDRLISAGKLQADKVRNKWETFCIAVIDNPKATGGKSLVVYGSDPRGTAYGLMELSRLIGISPYIYWADVKPTTHDAIYISNGETLCGPPSVKYRGIFINDEDWGLQPWAAKNIDTDVKDIGPRTYELVFELLLRLKGNAVWPAMHPSTKAFWYYKDNPSVACKYGIVLGSSHCEQMARNNVDEWVNNFEQEFGRKPGNYSWKDNSETIKEYWATRVRESRNQEMIYTLGMRGIHDSGLPGYSSNQERQAALNEIIAVQRQMITDNTGREVSKVPQMFCPYKETMTLYRMGLELPDDVTLMWVDDNFGYIRQLSNPEEQKRKGGGGVYYHLSYWGSPQDYLWLSGTQPALALYELQKAYDMNCRDMWIFNIGDIKPAEYELQYVMDFAWNANIDLTNTDAYTLGWATEIFGKDVAKDICEIKREYCLLSQSGRPEHINFVEYTRRQMLNRLERYHVLAAKVDNLKKDIPATLRDTYFELIEYPVKAATAMNEKVFGLKLSNIYAEHGYREETIKYADMCRKGYQDILVLTKQYNEQTAGGKWNGIMSHAPRGLAHFGEFTPATTDDVAKEKTHFPDNEDAGTTLCADSYKKISTKTLKVVNGLGVDGNSLTVLPISTTTYDESNITSAPFAEYKIPVAIGRHDVTVKCLPTFPIYSGMKLRYAISIDGSQPQFVDIATEAGTKQWSPNVLRGYSQGVTEYTCNNNHEATVRIYFADPGLVINSITVK